MIYVNDSKRLEGFLDLQERIQNNEWEDYDFTNSVYINSSTKLEGSCKTHGEFWISPNKLKRGRGCAKCAGVYQKTPEDYRKELGERFPEYETLEDYINNYTKILHKHKTCGHEWKVTPTTILRDHGCPKCAGNALKTPSDYRKELGVTEYEALENYINSGTKILHKHKVCGHEWETTPSHILRGHGCPKCSTSGFDPTKPAILYYLSVKNGTAFKIGITNRDVKSRYSNEELQDIIILKEWKFQYGKDAYEFEQLILEKFECAKYVGKALLKSGNTEMFHKDILSEI